MLKLRSVPTSMLLLFLVCSLGAGACAQADNIGQVASLTPQPTDAPIRPTPTASRTEPAPSIPTATPDLAAVVATSIALANVENYERGLELWDSYLAFDPSYADGYYRRGTFRSWAAPTTGYARVFFQEKMKALEDINRATELSPVSDGRYYWRRYQILVSLGGLVASQDGRTAYYERALENLSAANAIGPWSNLSKGEEVWLLGELDRSAESLTRAREHMAWLESRFPDSPVGLARGHALLGLAHLYNRQYAQGVQEYDRALDLDPNSGHWSWEYERSICLYFMGRSAEALEFLDEDIEAFPNFSGERYFLRALIRYDEGDLEGAEEDLLIGSGMTWGVSGVYFYVMGRLAAESGSVEDALGMLKFAEATLSPIFDPLIDRMQTEIRQLEANMAEPEQTPWPTPSIPLLPPGLSAGTPMPALTPSPTPLGPSEADVLCQCDYRIFDMDEGSGPLMIRSEMEVAPYFTYIYRFQPSIAVSSSDVEDLVYTLVPFDDVDRPSSSLGISFLDEQSREVLGAANWGRNRLLELGVVGRRGDVVMVVRNYGAVPIYLKSIAVQLISRTPSGGQLIQGSAPIGEGLSGSLGPAPSVIVDLDQSAGPLTVPAENGAVVGFSPLRPISYAQVVSLEVLVGTQTPEAQGALEIYTQDAWGGDRAPMERAEPGRYVSLNPRSAVGPDGSIVLELSTADSSVVEIDRLYIRLIVREEDGTDRYYGFDVAE